MMTHRAEQRTAVHPHAEAVGLAHVEQPLQQLHLHLPHALHFTAHHIATSILFLQIECHLNIPYNSYSLILNP